MVVWKVAEPSESGALLEGSFIAGTQFPVYSCFLLHKGGKESQL